MDGDAAFALAQAPQTNEEEIVGDGEVMLSAVFLIIPSKQLLTNSTLYDIIKAEEEFKCYNCGGTGHIARRVCG
jgi:hypothetical protein